MRVLLMPASYAPVMGGVQAVAGNLARGLQENGHEVLVITQRYPRSLPAQETVGNIKVRRLLFLKPGIGHLLRGRPDLLAASFVAFPAALASLTRIFEEFKPEIVNVHFAGAQIPFVLCLRKRFRFKLVVSFHGDDVEKFFDPKRDGNRKNFQELVGEADQITACSEYLLRRVLEIEPAAAGKIKTVHNGIDPEKFHSKISYDYGTPYILSYGRMVPKKGFDMLLTAFAQTAKGQNLHLILAGDGEQKKNLEALAKNLGIGDKVFFYGKATIKDLGSLLKGCEFVVIPSKQEPFGIAALEAMAAGKYIIATRVGGLPEVLKDAAYRLINPDVPEMTVALVETLGDLSQIQEAGKGNESRARRFDTSFMTDSYQKAYLGSL